MREEVCKGPTNCSSKMLGPLSHCLRSLTFVFHMDNTKPLQGPVNVKIKRLPGSFCRDSDVRTSVDKCCCVGRNHQQALGMDWLCNCKEETNMGVGAGAGAGAEAEVVR